MEYSGEFREIVRNLEEKLEKSRKWIKYVNETRINRDDFKSNLGFREKYLCGLFGGEKDKSRKLRRLDHRLKAYRRREQRVKDEVEEIDAKVRRELSDYLRIHGDEIFIALNQDLLEVGSVRDKSEEYFKLVDLVSGQVSQRVVDELSSFSFFGRDSSQINDLYLSSLVSGFREKTRDYRKTLDKYDKRDKGDGTNFEEFIRSILFLNEKPLKCQNLTYTECNLNLLRTVVYEISGEIESHYNQASTRVSNYLGQIRAELKTSN